MWACELPNRTQFTLRVQTYFKLFESLQHIVINVTSKHAMYQIQAGG